MKLRTRIKREKAVYSSKYKRLYREFSRLHVPGRIKALRIMMNGNAKMVRSRIRFWLDKEVAPGVIVL